MTAPARLARELRVIDSIAEIGPAAWSALAAACDAPVFYSYDFLRSVESQPLTYPSAARYLLATDTGGELVAALPVYLQQTADPFGEDDTVLRALVGHVWHCYDTRLLSRVPLTPELVGRFWDTLEDLASRCGAQLWGLANVALGEPLARHLAAVGVAVQPTVPRYRLPLRGGPASLDEHLATVGRASRRSLRQYCRRAARAGATITIVPGTDPQPDVLRLCLATADKRAPGYYPPQRLRALMTALGPSCRVIRVDLDGRLLAASICLLDQTRMHAWAGGCEYPPELNWSPQYVLFAAELEAGLASGLPMLECGRRNDEFKSRYGLSPHPLGRAIRRA